MEKKTKNEKSGLKNGDFGQNGSKKAPKCKNRARETNENSGYSIFEIPAPTNLINCTSDPA
jgi:hypothetical protein